MLSRLPLKSSPNQVLSTSITFFVAIYLLFNSNVSEASGVYVSVDDKYVSEGRDNLGQGGALWLGGTLWSGSLPTQNNKSDVTPALSIDALYGIATDPDVDYDELNLTFQVTWQLEKFNLYSYYNRLEYFKLGDKDNEFAVGLDKTFHNGVSANTELVYNTATDGRFLVINANKVVLKTQKHTITPHLQIGFDDGYASADHKGYNHSALGFTYTYKLTPTWSASLFAEYNFVGRQIESEGRDDITWINLKVSGHL